MRKLKNIIRLTFCTSLSILAVSAAGQNNEQDQPEYTTINGCEIKPHTICKKIDLRNADLRHARLGNADLEAAWLPKADLTRANFKNANLQETKFYSANLSYAEFEGARIHYAIFQDAYMEGCDACPHNW